MADTRHIQVLDKILEALGGEPPGGPAPFGLYTLNTTASLIAPFTGQAASNVSAVAGQLATLNTTASHIDGRLTGHRFAFRRPSELFVVSAANPAAGNTTLQAAPIGAVANIIHKIRMSFVASHNSPGREISFRNGAAGSTYFTTRIPPGFFTHEIDFSAPISQPAATAAVCFVATGFSAIGLYEVVLSQDNPSI